MSGGSSPLRADRRSRYLASPEPDSHSDNRQRRPRRLGARFEPMSSLGRFSTQGRARAGAPRHSVLGAREGYGLDNLSALSPYTLGLICPLPMFWAEGGRWTTCKGHEWNQTSNLVLRLRPQCRWLHQHVTNKCPVTQRFSTGTHTSVGSFY